MTCCVLHLSIALTDDGSVWTWGSNTDSQLGWPSQACAPEQGSSPQSQMRAVAGPQVFCPGASFTSCLSITHVTKHTSAVPSLVLLLCFFPPYSRIGISWIDVNKILHARRLRPLQACKVTTQSEALPAYNLASMLLGAQSLAQSLSAALGEA